MRPTFDLLAQGHGGDSGTLGIGSDNLFVHMTGMSDAAWRKIEDLGAQVSLAVPIEMNMRHGTPPVLKMESLNIEPSLSSDVEVTLLADFFYQMRAIMNVQRALVNQMILDTGFATGNGWPAQPPGVPNPHTRRAALRYRQRRERPAARSQDRLPHAGQGGRHHHPRRDRAQRGAAQPGAGAVVSLMDRTNVETVIVAGKVRKWKGHLLDVDLPQLRRQLEASRDHIFAAAGIPQDLFRSD
jgi:5-methylthioadenosine/S-adenosylhomocysteine deaminase